MAKKEGKLIANNKKAYHDYFILENMRRESYCMEQRSNPSAWDSAVSRKRLSGSKTGRCLFMECMFLLMKREISLIKIR